MMPKRARVALVVAVALVASGCGWTQFRGGPAGSGFNPAETTITRSNVASLRQAWSRPMAWTLPKTLNPSPIARSGDALVVASPDNSAVLDAVTGALRRPLPKVPEFPRAGDGSVAIVGSRAIITSFTADYNGWIRAVEIGSGAIAWGDYTAWTPTAPVVSDGRMFVTTHSQVGTHEYYTGASRVDDHSHLYSVSDCCGGGYAPAVAGDALYYTKSTYSVEPRKLIAADVATGVTRWSSVSTGCRQTAPVVAGDRVYANGRTYDAATGTLLWNWPTCPGSPIVTVSPSTLFVPYAPTATTSALQAVNAATGAVRWTIAWGRNAAGGPAVPAAANGLIFAADGDSLVAYDETTGVRVWRSPRVTGFVFDDPIVSDGMVYAMNTNGSVYAYSLSL